MTRVRVDGGQDGRPPGEFNTGDDRGPRKTKVAHSREDRPGALTCSSDRGPPPALGASSRDGGESIGDVSPIERGTADGPRPFRDAPIVRQRGYGSRQYQA